MIHFDANAKRSSELIQKGIYFGLIESAEMKANKNDPTKKPYLNLRYAITDKSGNEVGKMFDILSESDNELSQFKLSRFGRALNLEGKDFELKDIAKIVINKKLILAVTIQKDKNGMTFQKILNTHYCCRILQLAWRGPTLRPVRVIKISLTCFSRRKPCRSS